jgi:hypothetical protein
MRSKSTQNNPKVETFDKPSSSGAEEAAMHLVQMTKVSLDLQLLTVYILEGKDQEKVISLAKRLDSVFNSSFPFLTSIRIHRSKEAVHVVFGDHQGYEGKEEDLPNANSLPHRYARPVAAPMVLVMPKHKLL